ERWMTPARGSAMPPSTRSSEVLPAPLRPTSPTRSPPRSVKPTPSTRRVPPTSTVRPRTDSMVAHRGSASPRHHVDFGDAAPAPPVDGAPSRGAQAVPQLRAEGPHGGEHRVTLVTVGRPGREHGVAEGGAPGPHPADVGPGAPVGPRLVA